MPDIRMRLTPSQAELVKEAVTRHFGSQARVWVFGSRTDDSSRGGDFDFYVETDLDDPAEVIDRKLGLLAELHASPDFEGEKIDLIIRPALPGPYPPIYEVARRQGVPL
jgi:predicted nucleotidyltransferase